MLNCRPIGKEKVTAGCARGFWSRRQTIAEKRCQVPSRHWKDPLVKDFYSLTPQDLKQMESIIPLLAKRLVSKTVIKRRREESGALDHRRTLRQSMATGGVPAELFVKKRVRQKPVIFALCDVSLSCLHFSAFSLALVYSLQKFFRQVRCFAFVGETEGLPTS